MVEISGNQAESAVHAVLEDTNLLVSDGDGKSSIDFLRSQRGVNLDKQLQSLPDKHEAGMDIAEKMGGQVVNFQSLSNKFFDSFVMAD